LKKLIRTILSTTAVVAGFIMAGAVSANAATTYTVKAGDSAWAIAKNHQTTVAKLEATNHIQNHLILPGQELTIPGTGQATTTAPAQSAKPSATTYTGSNLQAYVLSQMASRTGVSAATWNMIITRESNWQPYVRNSSSGAYGLFQNMHIHSGSVEAQVDAAVALYHAQGMAAWAL